MLHDLHAQRLLLKGIYMHIYTFDTMLDACVHRLSVISECEVETCARNAEKDC